MCTDSRNVMLKSLPVPEVATRLSTYKVVVILLMCPFWADVIVAIVVNHGAGRAALNLRLAIDAQLRLMSGRCKRRHYIAEMRAHVFFT